MGASPRAAGQADVIAACYEAAIDATRWPAALELAIKACAADSAILIAGDLDRRLGAAIATGVGPDVVTTYIEHAWCSPLAPAAHAAPLYAPVYDRLVMPRGQFEGSGFFQDWARPWGLAEGVVSALSPIGPSGVVLTLMRERGLSSRPFTDDGALSRFAALAPHFGRAASIQRRLMRAEALPQGASAAALQALSVPLLLLDSRGRALWMNEAAETLLHSRDGLSSARDGGLLGASSAETAKLSRLLAEAAAGIGGAAPLRRPTGAPPLLALALPSGVSPDPWRSAVAAAKTPRIVLFVIDPVASVARRGDAAAGARLRALFGLTAAEAATALAAASGEGLPAAAEALGMALGTVRTHAKAVFAKTEVRGQADLARLLVRLGLIEERSHSLTT